MSASAPLHWGLLAGVAVAALIPGRVGLGVGLAAAWSTAAGGPAAPVLLVAAITRLAWRRSPWGLAVAGVGALLAWKQQRVAALFPAAVDPVPGLVIAAILAGGVVDPPRGRAPRLALAGVALAGAARLGAVWAVEGEERLARAERVGAVALVYPGLAADPALAPRLVRALPDADAALDALPVAAALDLGWRPQRAEGRPVEVARELERRGRGGEALRLLARHPRVGEVDWWRALYERTQGHPVRWRGEGGAEGFEVPGSIELGWSWTHDQAGEVRLTARSVVDRLVVRGEGSAAAGAWPRVELRLDGGPPDAWEVVGRGERGIPGPIEPGPHRLQLRFVNDAVAPDGDRNVVILSVASE